MPRTARLRTRVDGHGGAPEVEGEGEAVGEHGERAPGLLVAGDALDVHEPAGVQLAAAAAHVHAHLWAGARQMCLPAATYIMIC